ncbi:hypothetical protein FDH32_gp03 [Acinetobacter phage vB_AbaP_AS11]|uniref:Uncharacterized protein n=1 Tax=Acinetobacter phage vB_AbaP_AS11 TaxID=1932886 RepID=A0A218KRZ5_9CAUD|nr:hypothetical protein FDH32_gp03 [Acinetobacter phage vB_AbaP_AS11]AQN32655.1 hypothetical protein AS11_gp03 [Acinetobacter phage vB_AbaP_AS11]ULG00629.1 hypothetical protein PE21_gp03 [Acinetobacter phage vB_AbaP_PE21]
MEPTIKQLQDTIAQLQEALVNWNYVVAQDGESVQLPITKKMVHPQRGLCFAFFSGYPAWFVDEMWDQLKNPEGTWLYPVGGREEFYSDPIRWANPKRKELAERCVPYLQAKLEAALLKEGGGCS